MLKIELIRFKPQDIVTASTPNPVTDNSQIIINPDTPPQTGGSNQPGQPSFTA